MLTVGTEAPDFSIPLHTGATFHLAEHRGKNNVVLYFYPKDFTAGCTTQACSFSDQYDEIVSLDAVLVGVSADNSQRHEEFVGAYKLRFPLASDGNRAVMKLYDAIQFGIRTLRITYVIDKKGVIRGAAHHEFIMEKHPQFVLTTLRKIKAEQ